MNEIILATRNLGKIKEIQSILADLPVKIHSILDYPNASEVIEDGQTFEENALKKAKTVYEVTKRPAVSDDSGLEVFHLDMRPGIHSARYAGENVCYEENNKKLLSQLQGIPSSQRIAQFRCVAAFVCESYQIITEGICKGLIIDEPRGTGGFGYDPIFVPQGFEQTFAELPSDIKNSISHRGKAFRAMKEVIKKYLIEHGR